MFSSPTAEVMSEDKKKHKLPPKSDKQLMSNFFTHEHGEKSPAAKSPSAKSPSAKEGESTPSTKAVDLTPHTGTNLMPKIPETARV